MLGSETTSLSPLPAPANNFLVEGAFSLPFLVRPYTLSLPSPHCPGPGSTSSLHPAATAGPRAAVGAEAPWVAGLGWFPSHSSPGLLGWQQLPAGPARESSACALLFTEREDGRVTTACPGLSAHCPHPQPPVVPAEASLYCTVLSFCSVGWGRGSGGAGVEVSGSALALSPHQPPLPQSAFPALCLHYRGKSVIRCP